MHNYTVKNFCPVIRGIETLTRDQFSMATKQARTNSVIILPNCLKMHQISLNNVYAQAGEGPRAAPRHARLFDALP
jgi:hypothetical protein